MHTDAGKTQQSKSPSAPEGGSKKRIGNESTFQFVDKRPETSSLLTLQKVVNNSDQVKQLAALQENANINISTNLSAQLQDRNTVIDAQEAGTNEPVGIKTNNIPVISETVQRVRKVMLSDSQRNTLAKIKAFASELSVLIEVDEILAHAASFQDFVNVMTAIRDRKRDIQEPPLGGESPQAIVDGIIQPFLQAPGEAVAPGWDVVAPQEQGGLDVEVAQAGPGPDMMTGNESDQDWDTIVGLINGGEPEGANVQAGVLDITSPETQEIAFRFNYQGNSIRIVLHYHPAEDGNFLHFKNTREAAANRAVNWDNWLLTSGGVTRDSFNHDQ